ncbi:MAG: NADP oxidoreductase, partial [Actinomycetota bacterium]|nr:NADP oxidoreductase [Actinomycetota bacterium]
SKAKRDAGWQRGMARRPAARTGEDKSNAAAGSTHVGSSSAASSVPYAEVAPLIQEYGDQLAGKIVVDITNPVPFTTMSPAVAPGTSGAEEIAKVAPAGAKVVKAFNTTFAGTLVAGRRSMSSSPATTLDVFVAGDDADAKSTLSQVIEAGGLRAIDAGSLQRARQQEALGLLHMALQFTLNTGFGSAVKILV